MVYKQTYRNAWLLAVREHQAANPPERSSKADTIARLLPFVLHSFADPTGGSIRPSYAHLADIAGCSQQTVKRAMQTLEKAGLITRHGPAYRGRAQAWRLAAPDWLALPKGVQAQTPIPGERGSRSARKGVQAQTPQHSPLRGEGPYVTDDAPLGARVTETDNQTHVIPLQRAQALDAGCPECGSSKGKACRGLRPGRFHPERVATAS